MGDSAAEVADVLVQTSGKRSEWIHAKHSFAFVSGGGPVASPVTEAVSVPAGDAEEERKNNDKRTFLKAAGVAGVGLVASQLMPSRAHALVLGSSPTTGVVGVKNATNTRISPATEETVASLLKASDLDFDGSGYLNVNVQATSAGSSSSFSDSGGISKLALVDADRHVQVDVLSSTLPTSASTESTLQTLAFGGVKYALRMATSGNYDYIGEASIGSSTASAVWRVKRVDNTSGVVILWAGSGTFNQVWDNYASLTYA
jgi:hypothetical protein